MGKVSKTKLFSITIAVQHLPLQLRQVCPADDLTETEGKHALHVQEFHWLDNCQLRLLNSHLKSVSITTDG